MPVTTATPPVEPTAADLGKLIDELERSWKASITVRRTSKADVGYRDIYVSLDGGEPAILHSGDEVAWDVTPGKHQIRAHNTLFRKTAEVELSPGERATFTVINKAGFGTYSVLAFFVGGGPLYLSLTRETEVPRG